MSETIKLCKDCKHCLVPSRLAQIIGADHGCVHPKIYGNSGVSLNMVTGRPEKRPPLSAKLARLSWECGKNAKLFEPKSWLHPRTMPES